MSIEHKEQSFFVNSRTPSLDDLDPNPCHASWQAFCQRGEKGFDLSGSNPTCVGLDTINIDTELLLKAVNASYTASSQGLVHAREAIAHFYGNVISADRVQLFASTSEAVGALMKLLCMPGDEVITCIPTYPLLDCLTSLECVHLVEVPLQDCAGVWTLDFWALEQNCTERTRAIIVVSPNNPTGHCIARDEMDKLVTFCAERHVALIVDEVFASYRLNDNPNLVSQPACAGYSYGLNICLSGLSKVCGLPQHKLGWAVFGGDSALIDEAMQRLSYITDSTLSVSGWVQHLLPFLLDHRDEFEKGCIERLKVNKQYIHEVSLRENIQWKVDGVDGGWSICIRLPGWADDEKVATALAERGVRVFPGLFFGYRSNQPTLVLSLITCPEIFREGVERMTMILHDLLS